MKIPIRSDMNNTIVDKFRQTTDHIEKQGLWMGFAGSPFAQFVFVLDLGGMNWTAPKRMYDWMMGQENHGQY